MRAMYSPAPAVPAPGEASSVEGAEGLTRLCESLRDEASLSFSGNAVEQARAYEAHLQQRQTALARRYVTVVPAGGYAFRNYELAERRLVLDTNRGLILGEGAELLLPSQEAPPGFVLGPELADRILSQRDEGKVAFRLIFRPATSPMRKDGCLWLSGGRVVKLEIDLEAAALVAPDGTVLARSDGGDYADSSLATPVRSPKVAVRKPRAADGRDPPAAVITALGTLAERARPCYEKVLIVRPALRGTLVLGFRVGAGGRIESPRVEMSSLGDDTLTGCVASAASKLTLAGANAGQRLSVPLHFGAADD